MSQVFLPTKLYRPRPKSRLVSRPRLLRKLAPARERKLTLISAPAGFGKTTLLGEWLQQQGELDPPLPGTWLSLDTNDNDPARFTAYLVTALQKVEPDLGSEVQMMLKAGKTIPIDGVWEYLISEIVCVPSPFVIVLDDYHVIENPLIHHCLAFLLEQMPPPMHLVISSRADPPLPLSRLRVRGELVELRALDLRFNSEEMADFLALWIGKKLSAADQAELEARTEGWIAGLQLAALAIQSLLETEVEAAWDTSLSSFVHRLSGSTRFILDYLAEEVLRSQPEAIRSFLQKTCILERLTAPLCDVLTDDEGSQNILASLEKQNLFLFPLDDERAWFRYHHLFADLLRSSLQHQQPSLVVDLHRKASAWYESQGYFAEAVHHALKTPDPGEAARLMENIAIETIMGGEVDTVLTWAASIPDEQAKMRPSLCASFGWALILSGKMDQAMRYLHLPYQRVSTQESPSSCPSVEIALARAMIAYCMEDFENAFRYAQQVGEQLSQEPTYLHGMLKFILGAAYEMVGQDQAAFEACQEARHLNHAFGNRISELFALGRIGDLQIRRGQLHQASQTYQQALQLGKYRNDRLLPVAALPVFAMGRVLFEWNRLEEAEQYFHESADLSRKLGNRFTLQSSLLFLARIQLIRGEQDLALELQKEADQVGAELPLLPATVAPIALLRLRLYLLRGDTQAAVRLAQTQEKNRRTPCAFSQELNALFLVRLWLTEGNTSSAMEALEIALSPARAAGRWGSVIELLVLQVLVLNLERRVPEALTALEEALALAEPEGYFRVFADEGEPMDRLLRLAYRNREGGHKKYIARLLEAISPESIQTSLDTAELPEARPIKSRPILVDPLTERELEVLRMIIRGNSNREIADQLVITVGTVKAHVSSIFSKLDVRSRTQAISKVNQLGLL